MSVILAVLFIFVFFVFIAIGLIAHFRKKAIQWLFFVLSAFGILGTFLMFSIYNWDLGIQEKTASPKVVDSNKKTPMEQKESEQKNKTGTDESSPANQPSPIQPPAPTPSGQTEQKQNKQTPISIPSNGAINYQVVQGDTLWSIATRAGVSVAKIQQWNGLTSDTIYIGQLLKLYGKNSEPPTPPAPAKPETSSQASSVIIYHGSMQEKKIALTFDAGSDIQGIGILDVLRKHNIKATFFLTGKWAEKFPDYAKRIVNDGHEIGNHTYSHPDPVQISSEGLKNEIIKAEQVIKTVTGKSPRPYFRFPYGSYNAAALKATGEAGYPRSIQWSLDTIDWQQPAVDVIVSRIEAGASNGDIILMHIGGINTPSAVDQVIPILQAQGYKLVTVSELLN